MANILADKTLYSDFSFKNLRRLKKKKSSLVRLYSVLQRRTQLPHEKVQLLVPINVVLLTRVLRCSYRAQTNYACRNGYPRNALHPYRLSYRR